MRKAAGEVFAPFATDGIDRLPGDEHGHDGGLAGAGSEFQREAAEFGIGVHIRLTEIGQDVLSGWCVVRPR